MHDGDIEIVQAGKEKLVLEILVWIVALCRMFDGDVLLETSRKLDTLYTFFSRLKSM